MNSVSATILTGARAKEKAGLLLLVYIGIWVGVLRDFMPFTSLSFVVAVWALPFTLRREAYRPLPAVWAGMALLFLLLTFVVPVKTLLYFSVGGAFFLLLPLFACRPTFLSVAVWAVASPAFQYLTNVFSFPIRLQLTRWAGQVLSLSFKGITTRGNVIYYGANEFSVDPACMGLNMLVASLLLGIMTLGYYQLKLKRRVGTGWAILFLVAVVACNVVSNLLRIMLLVQFSVWPGTPMHEAVGLACLALYVLLPAALGAQLLVRRVGVSAVQGSEAGTARQPNLLFHCMLAALMVWSAVRVTTVDTYAGFKETGNVKLAGYGVSVFAPGILKLEADNSLIYVKYVRGFYDTDHNPSLCWKGSGYEFQQLEPKVLAGASVYTAVLVNGAEKLYTAWWYGNSRLHTTDQFRWRYDSFRGGNPYAVINVTTADEKSLEREVEKVIRQGALKPIFQKQ